MNDSIEELVIETNATERSGLATAAFICSLIICCPITTIIGPILGLISLLTLKGRAGRGFAWTAIIVGTISTIIWVIVGIFGYKQAMLFIEKSGEVVSTTIQAGYDNDYALFREELTRSSSSVSDEEIESFITELKSRYGKFDLAVLTIEKQNQTLKPSEHDAPITFHLIFETTDVYADALLEVIQGTGLDYDLKINCIQINDSKNGNLVFPNNSKCSPEVQESIELLEEPADS